MHVEKLANNFEYKDEAIEMNNIYTERKQRRDIQSNEKNKVERIEKNRVKLIMILWSMCVSKFLLKTDDVLHSVNSQKYFERVTKEKKNPK